jgi:hypothetical protein
MGATEMGDPRNCLHLASRRFGKTEEKEKTTGTTLLLSDGIQGVSATMF